MNVDLYGINTEIMGIWQKNLFQNATQNKTSISISKKEMIWPLIVLVVDKTAANEYKKDYNDDELEEIDRKYRLIINQETLNYPMISRILSSYKNSKIDRKQFVLEQWSNYLDMVEAIQADDSTKESLVKIILHRILTQRHCILNLKKGTGL